MASTIKMARCGHCDALHPITELGFGFRRPDFIDGLIKRGVPSIPIQELVPGEEAYCLYDADAIYNAPIREDSRAFVRVAILFPIKDSTDHYTGGGWVEVSIDDLLAIQEAEMTGNTNATFTGKMANAIPSAPESLGADVSISVRGRNHTALITFVDPKCALTQEQAEGIDVERVERFQGAFKAKVVEVPTH
jgi:hypothetical protein